MEEDYRIIHSPQEQRVTQGNISVEVLIYRGKEDTGWILEVVDHLGGSTVWDDQFATDKAALEEALSTIESEGIASFAAAQGRTMH
ncbi:hypothetical protein [Falsiroseomonas sp. E2-1-a20]|uniref:hypothetical protein n=1 Tax=Falsiroseomonas sp. E2-1-a20 TaxID=3239300 RepID=UPI003F38CE50